MTSHARRVGKVAEVAAEIGVEENEKLSLGFICLIFIIRRAKHIPRTIERRRL